MKKTEATGYWRQACEALDTTQMALLRGNHNNAVTMSYQAMEHGAKALLAANDVETGSHHAVQVQVSLHLVKSSKAGKEYSSALRQAYQDRTKATYSSNYQTPPAHAESATDRAHDYLTKARAQLQAWGLTDNDLAPVPAGPERKPVKPGGDPKIAPPESGKTAGEALKQDRTQPEEKLTRE